MSSKKMLLVDGDDNMKTIMTPMNNNLPSVFK